MPDNAVITFPQWYAWSQFLLCTVAGFVLLAVYRRGFIDSKDPNARYLKYDRCYVYLALANFTWAAVGALLLYRPLGGTGVTFIRTLLSIANSTALIFAAAHLDYGRPMIRRLQRDTFLREVPNLGVVALVLFVVGLGSTTALRGVGLASLPDFIISVVTLGVLILGLWESFRSRGFGVLAAISICVLAFQVFAQVPEVSASTASWLGEYRWVFLLSSKVMMIYLFLALAYTWMHQRYREAQSSDLNVELTLGAPSGGRSFPVRISSRFGATEFNLGRITYLRLLELALARILDDPDEGYVSTDHMFDSPTNIDNHVRHIRRTAENHLGGVYKDLQFDLIETSRERQTKRLAIAPHLIEVDIDGICRWRNENEIQKGDPWEQPLLREWLRHRNHATISSDVWEYFADAVKGRGNR